MNAPRRRGACPGVAVPMQTGDGLLVRLASLGATIPLIAAAELGAAARRHGNGIIEVTARGSIQIRGLNPASAPAFADAVAALGLDAGDGVSILVDPLAGLEAEQRIDACGLAAALRQRLAAVSFAARLGPKVSVVIDGGSVLHLDALRADVRLRATDGGWQVGLGGDDATATPMGLVAAANADELVVQLLERLAQRGPRARACDLIREQGPEVLRGAIADLLIDAQSSRDDAANSSPPRSKSDVSDFDHYECRNRVTPTSPAGRESNEVRSRINFAPLRTRSASNPIGAHPLCDGVALGIGLAFGHTNADVLDHLIEAAREAGARGLRTAPGRALLLIGVVANRAPKLAARAQSLGFVTRLDDPRRHVVACAGAPICAAAEIPARTLGPAISSAAAALLDGSLTVHVSGCPKGCAHPRAAALTIVGSTDGCGLVIDGSARDRPGVTIATTDLPSGFGRLAQEVARTRRPGQRAADTFASLGPARIAAILGAGRHG
jgi:precorrin-3B synthase